MRQLSFACPECGKTFRVKDELAGKKVRCAECQASITVPSITRQPAVNVPTVSEAPPSSTKPQKPASAALIGGACGFAGLLLGVVLGVSVTVAVRPKYPTEAEKKEVLQAIGKAAFPGLAKEELRPHPEKADDADYVDASSKPLEVGTVRLTFKSDGIAIARGEGFNSEISTKEKVQRVLVTIENTDENKKIDYLPWGNHDSFAGEGARARDDLGNRYSRIKPGFMKRLDGQAQGSPTIRPGEPVKDLLLFEKPVPKAKFLLIDLPASHIDQKGTIRVKVPLFPDN